jgi:hypothetical protein
MQNVQNSQSKPNLQSIKKIRYIKLGSKGQLEEKCIQEGLCYIGFGSSNPVCFNNILDATTNNSTKDKSDDWKKVWEFHFANDPDGSEQARRARATSATNQLQSFFEAGEDTLWITFHARKLYFSTLCPTATPQITEENLGCFRSVTGKWYCTDIGGNELLEDKLSGRLTQTKSFRGTSCDIKADVKDYLLRRINRQLHPYQLKVEETLPRLRDAIAEAIRSFSPEDFEILVELIFSGTLRRISSTGKVQQFVDIVFENPLDGNQVCVQVKSQTTPSEFLAYLKKTDRKIYDSFYYVYHSSEASVDEFKIPDDLEDDRDAEENKKTSIKVLDVRDIASMSIDVGLIKWVMDKAG